MTTLSTVSIGFSIYLLSVELISNLAFCVLNLLPSLSVSLHKSILRSMYGFNNDSCLNSNII